MIEPDAVERNVVVVDLVSEFCHDVNWMRDAYIERIYIPPGSDSSLELVPVGDDSPITEVFE